MPNNIQPSMLDRVTSKGEWLCYKRVSNRLYMSDTYYFEDISENVWEFEIGGYKRWKKSVNERKGMELDWQEADKINNIAMSLRETIHIMNQIDKFLGEASGFGLT